MIGVSHGLSIMGSSNRWLVEFDSIPAGTLVRHRAELYVIFGFELSARLSFCSITGNGSGGCRRAAGLAKL